MLLPENCVFAENEVEAFRPGIDEARELRVDEHVVAVADLHANRFATTNCCFLLHEPRVRAVQNVQVIGVIILEDWRHYNILGEISEERNCVCVDECKHTVLRVFAWEGTLDGQSLGGVGGMHEWAGECVVDTCTLRQRDLFALKRFQGRRGGTFDAETRQDDAIARVFWIQVPQTSGLVPQTHEKRHRLTFVENYNEKNGF